MRFRGPSGLCKLSCRPRPRLPLGNSVNCRSLNKCLLSTYCTLSCMRGKEGTLKTKQGSHITL